MRLRPEQQGCKDHGHGEEGKSYDENCHCSDPLQPPSPSVAPPPGAAEIRPLLLESPLELLSWVHVIPPTGHRAPLCLWASYLLDRGSLPNAGLGPRRMGTRVLRSLRAALLTPPRLRLLRRPSWGNLAWLALDFGLLLKGTRRSVTGRAVVLSLPNVEFRLPHRPSWWQLVGWRLAVDAGLQTCPSGPGLWATVDDRGRVLHYLPVVVDVLNLRDDPLESPHP
jgi:hypothetical protein